MLIITFRNFLNRYITILIKKWRITNIKLKSNTPYSPDINTTIVFIFQHNLRSCVIKCSNRLSWILPYSCSKISDFVIVILYYDGNLRVWSGYLLVLYLGVRCLVDGDSLLPREADREFILLRTFCLRICSMNFFVVLLTNLSQL